MELTERRELLASVLVDRSTTDGTQITIGAENGAPELADLTVITANYSVGQLEGVVGVIGPTRMRYEKIVSLVDCTSSLVSSLLRTDRKLTANSNQPAVRSGSSELEGDCSMKRTDGGLLRSARGDPGRGHIAEIKKAYRSLAMDYHPDRNDSPDAEEKFRAVTEAYEVLRDPEQRSLYDRFGEAGVKRGAGGADWRVRRLRLRGCVRSLHARVRRYVRVRGPVRSRSPVAGPSSRRRSEDENDGQPGRGGSRSRREASG